MALKNQLEESLDTHYSSSMMFLFTLFSHGLCTSVKTPANKEQCLFLFRKKKTKVSSEMGTSQTRTPYMFTRF